MTTTAAAFREACRDYRQNFRALFAVSALLSLPTSAVVLLRSVVAGRLDLPFSDQSGGVLALVDFLVSVLTPGAVALLAADRRTGGTWRWRDAWARAASRADTIITGYLAALFVFFLLLTFLFALVGDDWVSRLVFRVVVAIFLFGWLAIFGLLPVVTSVERIGGFRALDRTWQTLRKNLRRNVVTVGLAKIVAFLPIMIVLVLVLLHVELPVVVIALFIRVYDVFITPLIVLVALSVYCDARRADGAGTAQLRADLDAG